MEPEQNNAPMTAMGTEEKTKAPVGTVIGIIIVLALIVLGGLYFWGKQIDTTQPADTNGANTSQAEDDTISSIEVELNAGNPETTTSDIDSVDAEFQSAAQ